MRAGQHMPPRAAGGGEQQLGVERDHGPGLGARRLDMPELTVEQRAIRQPLRIRVAAQRRRAIRETALQVVARLEQLPEVDQTHRHVEADRRMVPVLDRLAILRQRLGKPRLGELGIAQGIRLAGDRLLGLLHALRPRRDHARKDPRRGAPRTRVAHTHREPIMTDNRIVDAEPREPAATDPRRGAGLVRRRGE
jgi:hypothetical protein